jgi:hypothetical protein
MNKNNGAGNQRRYKLLTPMKNIEPAIKIARNLQNFTKALKLS